MTDNKDCEIGRRVVSTLMMQGLAAIATRAGDFHEFCKQWARAATWAFSSATPQHGLLPRPVGKFYMPVFHRAKVNANHAFEKGATRRAAACRKLLSFLPGLRCLFARPDWFSMALWRRLTLTAIGNHLES